jgi:hypothetical protein
MVLMGLMVMRISETTNGSVVSAVEGLIFSYTKQPNTNKTTNYAQNDVGHLGVCKDGFLLLNTQRQNKQRK